MARKDKDTKKEDALDLPERGRDDGIDDLNAPEEKSRGKKFKVDKLVATLAIACIILVITLACTLYAFFSLKNSTKALSTDLDLCKRGAYGYMVGQD